VSASDRSSQRRAVAVLLLLLGRWPALAQSADNITDADIERANRSQPVVSEQDIERAQQKNRMPTEAELRAAPVPATPHLDRLPQPQTSKAPSLEAIAMGYEVSGAGGGAIPQTRGVASGPGLLVFVSFSMPQPTLQRLLDQAALARATLVLRGFVNGSLQETVLRAQRLIGERDVAFQIDPQAFDRFAIDKTPSFVLVQDGAKAVPCTSGQCFATDGFVRIAGDVSLDYALEHMQRMVPKFSRDAARFLKRLRN
jgi:conjugal transfer pilus assembly protein TrbC